VNMSNSIRDCAYQPVSGPRVTRDTYCHSPVSYHAGPDAAAPVDETLVYARQIANALEIAHERISVVRYSQRFLTIDGRYDKRVRLRAGSIWDVRIFCAFFRWPAHRVDYATIDGVLDVSDIVCESFGPTVT
jgi:hypothetical protein